MILLRLALSLALGPAHGAVLQLRLAPGAPIVAGPVLPHLTQALSAPLAPLGLTPALMAPSLALAPLPVSIVPAALSPVAAVAPAAAATPQGPFGALPSAEQAAGEGALYFDGAWSQGSFQSPVDEAILHFKRRASPSQEGRPPMVFVGGLGLSESFEGLFKAAPARSEQVFLWLRGNEPSLWASARHPLDADARDLARMIVTAARQAGAASVELALHSYASLVFQRMLQMGEHAEVQQALDLLRGSRVLLLNATTHFKGSESSAAPEYAQMVKMTALFVGWLDSMDAAARLWRQTPIWSPTYAFAQAWLASWSFQRAQALELAAKGSVAALRKDLKGPWAPQTEEVRRQAALRLERNAHDAGWQEALVRRFNDGALLQAKAADVKRLLALGIRAEVVVSHDDQIIPWSVSRMFLEFLGIKAPKTLPVPGTTLKDASGQVRVRIVAGDHYVPLKDPAAIDQLIGR